MLSADQKKSVSTDLEAMNILKDTHNYGQLWGNI